jgi:hypothetical protein
MVASKQEAFYGSSPPLKKLLPMSPVGAVRIQDEPLLAFVSQPTGEMGSNKNM